MAPYCMCSFIWSPQVIEKYFLPLVGKDMWNVMPVLLRPESRGTIRLRSRSFKDPPIINANFLDKPKDVEVLIDGENDFALTQSLPQYLWP